MRWQALKFTLKLATFTRLGVIKRKSLTWSHDRTSPNPRASVLKLATWQALKLAFKMAEFRRLRVIRGKG